MKKRNYNERGDNMSRTEINEIYEEHFVALSKAAKNKCSGEELKAITEALIMTEKRLNEYN